MDMTMSSIRPTRVEVVTSVQRRRRWSSEQKLEIVKQTNEPRSSVSLVCARKQLKMLRRKLMRGAPRAKFLRRPPANQRTDK